MSRDNVIPMPDPENDLQQQAMRWVVRLNSGEASQQDRQAFTRWVQEKEQHREAFFSARTLWQQMGELALPTEENQHTHSESPLTTKTLKSQPRKLYATIAIPFLIICVLIIQPLYVRYFIADYNTAVGEIQTVYLPDGSTVYLNTDSMIVEHYSAEHRNIELLAGEAEFIVAHDKQRPFIVSAGNGKTRALGTRFVVKYSSDTVRVSVLENAVEISSKNHASVTLKTGYKLEYGDKGLLDIPKTTIESEQNAWRYGKLKFNAQPLKQVIAEINRYLPGKIVLANEDYASHQVSGVFEIKNLDRSVEVIAKSLKLQTASLGRFLFVVY